MMRPLSLTELVTPLAAQLCGTDCEVSGVSTDSRALRAGDLFIALRGEKFDGHAYLQQVCDAGAAAALVSSRADIGLPQLLVADTQRALGLLGAYNRQLYSAPLVAITGSSGKTTVKNMVHAVLSQRGATLATQGNFNNEIGVPLTLLRLQPDLEFAVVEMGAGKAGDIDWLCQLAQPTVSVLLNAMPAHLQGFGSVEGVATAKGEIFDRLRESDTAVINADQPWAKQWRKRAGAATILDFGVQQPAAISARGIHNRGVEGVSFTVSSPVGEMAMRIAFPGIHNVANALAAVAVGLACGLKLTEIRNGLESIAPVDGRMRSQQSAQGAVVIDDCYNANPGSVRAAIDMLAGCAGRRTLMLGAMLELGENSDSLHREIGAYARAAGIESVWGVGPELAAAVEAFGTGARHFADRAAAVSALAGQFGTGDTVLIKGSRGAGMEEVVHALLPELKVQGG